MSKIYSEFDKETAIAGWVETETYSGASRASGIPAQTIRSWRYRLPTWWGETVDRLREINKGQREAKLIRIMNQCSDEILERLEKGDEKVNSKGEKYRVKVSARDTAVILGICTEKYSLSLGLPTKISSQAKVDSTVDRLQELKDAARVTRLNAVK